MEYNDSKIKFNSDIEGYDVSLDVVINVWLWSEGKLKFHPEGRLIHICNPSALVYIIQDKPCSNTP